MGSIDKNSRLEILNSIAQIASKNNVCLLSTEYINRDSPLTFKCLQCGTSFYDTWTHINSRRNKKLICPNCNPQKTKEDYYYELKKIVESKGGVLISTKYENTTTKVEIRCKNNHQWWITPNDIKQGYWCNECYILNKRMQIEKEIREIIESKGGVLKEIDFSSKKTRVLVVCKKHHSWWTTTSSIKEGKWCKICYLNYEEKHLKLKNYIEKKGGTLLSTNYEGVKDKVLIKCSVGHRWDVTPDNILNGSTWCPHCHHLKTAELFKKNALTAPFDFKSERLRDKGAIAQVLFKYLKNIQNLKYPYEEFSGNEFRASKLKFIGSIQKKADLIKIKNFLLSKRAIGISNNFFHYIQLTNKVYSYFQHRKNKKPYHPPILKFLLKNHNYSVAIEVPVWRKIEKLDIYFTGHIDLLAFHNDVILVIDFKQNRRQLINSIPQVMAYGLMLNERLRDIRDNLKYKIFCVLLTKDISVGFKPHFILPTVLEYSKTNNFLIGKLKGSSLYEDIIRLLL
ncbi:MAG: hypothetical protein ACFE9Y_15660 [Promethearchaeota archaeon]